MKYSQAIDILMLFSWCEKPQNKQYKSPASLLRMWTLLKSFSIFGMMAIESLNHRLRRAFTSLPSPLLFHYALRVPMTTQYKPTVPPTNIIAVQRLPVQSYSPLTSPDQSSLREPYDKETGASGGSKLRNTKACQVPRFQKKKKAGLCLTRNALFKRQLRGINRVNTWQGPTICSP